MTSKAPASGKSRQIGYFNGFDLFLRFADGCRHYLDDKGVISKEDSAEIRLYLEDRGMKPSEALIRKIYHVAYPGLQKVCSRLKARSIFERRVVREFFAFDHNQNKYEQGNLICLAYPARVREVVPGLQPKVLVDFEPLTGIFKLDNDFPLKKGDWVIVHRMSVIDIIDKAFADRTMTYLRKLGLDKTRKFPRKAYKYFNDLKESSDKRHCC